jgi:hypothetical protein
MNIMRMTMILGSMALATWLILRGLIHIANLAFSTVVVVLAITVGVFILLRR